MTIKYEMKVCSRCGGSGHYSFNSMHGSTCYGCSGGGKLMTPKGRKAHAAIQEFKRQFAVPVATLAEGDRVQAAEMGVRTKTGFIRITVGAHQNIGYADTVVVGYGSKAYGTQTATVQHHCPVTTKVVPALSADQFAALAAFARTLKGVTVE